MHDKILILDFGSQVTQLIARRVREAGVYSEVHPCDMSEVAIRAFGARGVILSGSHMSAYEEVSDTAPPAKNRPSHLWHQRQFDWPEVFWPGEVSR